MCRKQIISACVLHECVLLKMCITQTLSTPSLLPIQGDGISYESLTSILDNMQRNKWSADNLVFGSGGALLQRLHRDTQKCAYKCSYAIVNGKGVSSAPDHMKSISFAFEHLVFACGDACLIFSTLSGQAWSESAHTSTAFHTRALCRENES